MTINKQGLWRYDLALLGLAILVYFCIGLGAHQYIIPSEARYIEIPRQMLTTGDWVTPRINGVPYFEKPPLFYWMQATALGMFGMNEWAGRIVTALLTTLTCLTTYLAGRMLYGRMAGLLAAGVLATSLMGYGLAHVAMLDVPVTLFITVCLVCFLAAQHTEKGTRRNLYLLMYVASALAMLTKGLIGIVIPGMVIGAWIALTKKWSIIKQAHLFTGLCIFLIIAAPWHVLMGQRHPDFLNFYFIHEHFTRYMTDEHKRNQPWWFFIAIAPVGLLPWTFLLPIKRRDNNLFLLLWIILPLIFFSTSHSKLISYIFPIFPPLAIMLGRTLDELWQGKLPLKNLRLSAIIFLAIMVIAVACTQMLPELTGKAAQKLAMLKLITLPMLLPMVLAGAYLCYTLIKKRAAQSYMLALALAAASIGFTANYIIAPLDMASTKPLASELKTRLSPEDMVVAYGTYWQDLPVYLNRNITVVDWTGELSFEVEHYPQTKEWMIPAGEFWKRCAAASHGVYVFMNEDMFKTITMTDNCPLHITARYGNILLLEKTSKKE